jgi:hypothetical protein
MGIIRETHPTCVCVCGRGEIGGIRKMILEEEHDGLIEGKIQCFRHELVSCGALLPGQRGRQEGWQDSFAAVENECVLTMLPILLKRMICSSWRETCWVRLLYAIV